MLLHRFRCRSNVMTVVKLVVTQDMIDNSYAGADNCPFKQAISPLLKEKYNVIVKHSYITIWKKRTIENYILDCFIENISNSEEIVKWIQTHDSRYETSEPITTEINIPSSYLKLLTD